jgi:PhoPQ-activated pathogenicity-related protein
MKFVQSLLSLVFALLAVFMLPVAANATALDDYVAAPDSNYLYVEIDFAPELFTTAYTLELTSQAWRDSSEVSPVVWTHWVTVYKPTSDFIISTSQCRQLLYLRTLLRLSCIFW